MSFSEMMESGRGPGMIGTLLATVVLVGFGCLYFFVFDEGMQGADQTIESIISQQSKELEGIKAAISRGKLALGITNDLQSKEQELAGIHKENQVRDRRLAGLRQELTATSDAIAAKAGDFEAYKDEYRALVRGKAKGQIMERLETRNGTGYDHVTIREVTAIGIQFRHEGGFKRIPYEDLPDAMQDHFQFDPSQKAAAIAKEVASRNEHESAVSAANEAADRQLAEQRKQNAELLKENKIRALALKESRVKALGEEIRNLQQAILREVRKPLSRAPQMRAQLADKQNELTALQAEVSRLRSEL